MANLSLSSTPTEDSQETDLSSIMSKYSVHTIGVRDRIAMGFSLRYEESTERGRWTIQIFS